MITDELRRRAKDGKKRNAYGRIQSEADRGLRALYGGDDMAEDILEYSRHENPAKLDERRKKTVCHYKNFIEYISSQYIESVNNAGPVVRATGDPTLDTYFEKVYPEWFNAEVALFALILPELYVRVRMRSPEEKGVDPTTVTTRAHEAEIGLLPEPCVIYPQHILDFCQDETGELHWVMIEQCDTRTGKDGGKLVEIITREERCLFDPSTNSDVEPAEAHGFNGMCPVVRLVYKENQRLGGNVGHAFMASVINLTIAVLQWDGMAVEGGYAGLSSKLVADDQTAENIKEDGIGAFTIIREGKKGVPKDQNAYGNTRYLTMDGFPLEFIAKLTFEDLPGFIMKVARLVDRSSTKELSGLAKLMDSVPEIGVTGELCRHFQRCDMRIGTRLAHAYRAGLRYTSTYPNPAETAAVTGAGTSALRGSVGGSQLIATLQEKYSNGTLSREAVVANLVVVFGFEEEEALKLFPEKAPVELTATSKPAPATNTKAKKYSRGGLREPAPPEGANEQV